MTVNWSYHLNIAPKTSLPLPANRQYPHYHAELLSSDKQDEVINSFASLYRAASAVLDAHNLHDTPALHDALDALSTELQQASPALPDNRLQTLKLLLEIRQAKTFTPRSIESSPYLPFIERAILIEQESFHRQKAPPGTIPEQLQYLSRITCYLPTSQAASSLWKRCKAWFKQLMDWLFQLKLKTENSEEWARAIDQLYRLYHVYPQLFEQPIPEQTLQKKSPQAQSPDEMLITCYAKGSDYHLQRASVVETRFNGLLARNEYLLSRFRDFNWQDTVSRLDTQLSHLEKGGLCCYKKTELQRRKDRGDFSAYLNTYQEMNTQLQTWSAQALEQYSALEQHLRKFHNYLGYMDDINAAFLRLQQRCVELPRVWLKAMDDFFPASPELQQTNAQLQNLHKDEVDGLKQCLWLEHVCYSRRSTEIKFFKYEMEARNKALGKALFKVYLDDDATMVTDLHLKHMLEYQRKTRGLLLALHPDKQKALGVPVRPEVSEFVTTTLNELRERNQQAYLLWSQSQWGTDVIVPPELRVLSASEPLPQTVAELGEPPAGPKVTTQPSTSLGLFILVLRKHYVEHMNLAETTSLHKKKRIVPWGFYIYPEPEQEQGTSQEEAYERASWYGRHTKAACLNWAIKAEGIAVRDLSQIQQETREVQQEIREVIAEKIKATNMLILRQKRDITTSLSEQLKGMAPDIPKETFHQMIQDQVNIHAEDEFFGNLSREAITIMVEQCCDELCQTEEFRAYQEVVPSAEIFSPLVPVANNRNGLFNQTTDSTEPMQPPAAQLGMRFAN